MKRQSRRAVLVAGAGLLGGCSGVPLVGSDGDDGFEVTERWPSWQYDDRNTGRTGEITGPSGRPSVAWHREIGPGNGGATPVVADGKAFVGSGDGTFHALDAATGETRWTAETRKWIHSTAAVGEDFVVVGSDDFTVRAYHWDGTERWQFRADFEVSADPVLGADRVYVPDTTETVYALDRADGSVVWRRTLPVETTAYLGSPVVADGDLFVPGATDTWRLATADGTVEWRTDDDRDLGETHALAGDRLVGTSNGSRGGDPGAVYALDRASGEVAWVRELSHSYPSSVAVADGTAYLSDADGLAARSVADGGVDWRVDLGGPADAPVLVDGTLYCAAAGSVHAVDPDGEVRWSVAVDPVSQGRGGSDASPLAVASGTLYAKLGTTVVALRA